MPKVIGNKLIETFKERSSFDRNELYDFYLDSEPDLKESTFSWRIYDLKKKDIIKTIGRGLYVISYNAFYYNKSSIHGAYEEFFLKFHCYILHRCHNLFGFSF